MFSEVQTINERSKREFVTYKHTTRLWFFLVIFVIIHGIINEFLKETLRVSWDLAGGDCHPSVCNELVTVYAARYPLMIRCSLSSTLSSVKHILQDVNREAQICTCKQPFKRSQRGPFCSSSQRGPPGMRRLFLRTRKRLLTAAQNI